MAHSPLLASHSAYQLTSMPASAAPAHVTVAHAPLVNAATIGNDSLKQLAKQPDHEIFHCMISYRVNTDADLARAIHDRLHFKALNAKKKLEFYAAAKYPSGFNRARDTKQSWVNIFLDKVCLQTGKDWADEGFILALLQSLSVIPILSWKESSSGNPPTGSIGQLAQHGANSSVDNVLLELVLTKELHSTWQLVSKQLNRDDFVVFPCMHIVPVYAQDLFSKLSTLSEEAPAATLKKAAEVLRCAGHVTSSSFMHQSVKSIVSYFTRVQGIKYYELGNADSANEQVASRLWEILKNQAQNFDIDRFQMNSFAQNNPHGTELLKFLTESDCSYLSRFLIKHNISSVASLADLKSCETSISALAQETSKSCKRPLMEETLKIKRAINLASGSPLSFPLKKRLLNFVDKDASVLTAVYSSSACDIMLSKPTFQFVMITIGVIAIALGINSLFEIGALSGSAITLMWTGALMASGAIVAIFYAPRFGRYLYSVLFVGDIVIHISLFVATYFVNGRTVLNQNDDKLLISSLEWGEFGRSYQFLAQLLFFMAMFFTLTFRQQFAWCSFTIFLAHYGVFLVVMNLTMLRPPSRVSFLVNGFVGGGCTCLLSITEFLKRLGKAKAMKLVLQDLQFRQLQWSQIINNPVQSQKIDQIEVLLRRSNFAPVCENLSPENSLIPIQVLQPHSSIDIDQIFRDCTVLNFFFQDWVWMWFTSGKDKDEFEYCNPKSQHKDIFKLHIGDCFPEVLRGPIKSPNRAISKIYRSYRGEVKRVTDFVRCAVVFSNVDDLLQFLEGIQRFTSSSLEAKPFEVVRVRNRFNPRFDSKHSAGYRDLAFKIKVGFERSPTDNCWLLPVHEWEQAGAKVVVCEIQAHLKDFSCLAGSIAHKNYVTMRDLLAQ